MLSLSLQQQNVCVSVLFSPTERAHSQQNVLVATRGASAMESEQLDVTLTGRDEREKEDRNKKTRGKRASSFGLPGRPSECALGE